MHTAGCCTPMLLRTRTRYASLVFLEQPVWATPQAVERFLAPRPGWCSPSELIPYQLMQLVDLEAPRLPVLSGRGLKRCELGTRYPVIVADVAQLMAAQPLPILTGELKNFRVKLSVETAHDSYSAWREHEHDDMVLATALACWWAERPTPRGFSMSHMQIRAALDSRG